MNRPVALALACGLGLTGMALAQEGARSQGRLEREVRHELVMLPYYGVFDNLAFKVNGDKVTLLGEATRPTLKTDAGAVVKKIEGVESVAIRSKYCRCRLTMIASGWPSIGRFTDKRVLVGTRYRQYPRSTSSSRMAMFASKESLRPTPIKTSPASERKVCPGYSRSRTIFV
jgi:hypothetical protein